MYKRQALLRVQYDAPGPQQGDTIPHQHAVGGNAHQTHAAHDLGDAVVIEHHAPLHAGEEVTVALADEADAKHGVVQEVRDAPDVYKRQGWTCPPW